VHGRLPGVWFQGRLNSLKERSEVRRKGGNQRCALGKESPNQNPTHQKKTSSPVTVAPGELRNLEEESHESNKRGSGNTTLSEGGQERRRIDGRFGDVSGYGGKMRRRFSCN